MKLRVRSKHCIVFAPFGGFVTESGLYTPVHGWGDHCRAKPIFLLDKADDALIDAPRGTRLWVSDGFELMSTKDLYDAFKHLPDFKELNSYIETTKAKVRTCCVNYKAILAIG